MMATVSTELARLLFEESGEHVYTILDGASIPDLLDKFVSDTPRYECLYRGELGPDMAEVAAYLVLLEADSPFTNWVLTEGWGNHWGIFARTGIELQDLRRHFRRFLIVHDPEGEPMYFRYYDPRVLRVFLPTSNMEELATMFGPISCFLLEGEDSGQCIEFTFDGTKLGRKEYSVAAQAAKES
jgi:hypothetical protein